MNKPLGEPSAPLASPREGLIKQLLLDAAHLEREGYGGMSRRLREAAQSLEAATLREQRLREAFDRTLEYIRTAMKPTSVKESCGEGIWERAHRSGLQHGLNAIIAEFAKAGVEYPSALLGDRETISRE